MKSVRPLLAMGNGKLGSSIFHFDHPPILTCPGRSSVCEQVCYATTGRFVMSIVQDRLQWCLEQSQEEDFVKRMTREIHRKGILVVRIHVSGDFYDEEYAAKWLEVMQRCNKARLYFYTRSWRIAEIRPILEEMASLDCCRAWYSVDAETGIPASIPTGVRLAHLQTAMEEEIPEAIELLFRDRSLRNQPFTLPVLCSNETPRGREREVNCGNCARCWS